MNTKATPQYNILIISQNVSNNMDNFIPRVNMLGVTDEFELCLAFRLLNQNCMLADQNDLSLEKEFPVFIKGHARKEININEIDVIISYDLDIEPSNLPRLMAFLDQCHKDKILLVNPLDTIRYGFDKLYLLEMQDTGIPIIPTYTYHDLDKIKQGGHYIIKPRQGHKGSGIILNINESNIALHMNEDNLLQEYCNKFNAGEYSLVFIANEYQYSFSRHKSDTSNQFNNLSKGGYIRKYYPSSHEIEFGLQVMNFLQGKKLKIDYCRIDFVKSDTGCLLNEVEVSCPILVFKYDDQPYPCSVKLAKHILSNITTSHS